MEQRLARAEVAQIFNLPYRRVALGKAFAIPNLFCKPAAPQIANLRYSRMQFCATSPLRHRCCPWIFDLHNPAYFPATLFASRIIVSSFAGR
jgi:hypothetical protein